MTRRPTILLTLAAALALPAAASAQVTGATGPTGPAAPAPAPAPAPAAPQPVSGKLSITPEKVGSGSTVLAGSSFRVRGVLQPYVAGQKATVRFYRGSRKLGARTLTLRRSATGKSGYFVTRFTARRAGSITVRATHAATAAFATTKAKAVTIRVLGTSASMGSRGPVVRELQRRLKALGYVPGSPGVYDGRTARAVQAFRKMTGMARTFGANRAVFAKLLSGGGAFKVRYPSHGRHIEGDLTHQVLALIGAGGKVERLYPMSSGKPSTPTVLGHFKVYNRTPGTNSHGMVYSSYFIRGYAVHGYAEVPSYAASHGCLRVPVPDAVPIYDWIRYGTPVDVYYR